MQQLRLVLGLGGSGGGNQKCCSFIFFCLISFDFMLASVYCRVLDNGFSSEKVSLFPLGRQAEGTTQLGSS